MKQNYLARILHVSFCIKNHYLFTSLFVLFCSVAFGQTTLISPTVSNGGFETNLTGWSTAQTGLGRGAWYDGTATTYAGSRSAYISNNSGAANAYTGDAGRVQHLYRAVTFPAGETIINLSFYWKCLGEGAASNDYDNLKVFVSNTIPTAGNANAAADLVGANWYNQQTTWQNASITLPASLAGTTKYLIFQWKQDGSDENQPPAAIDNINLTTQGTSVTYCTPITTGTIDYISAFSTTLGTTNITNNSGALSGSGYGDFYATHTATQVAGSTLNFSETYNGGSHGLSIWVDFNKDGIFQTTERLFNATTLVTALTGTITIPLATAAGDYRMRVRAWYGNLNPDPCTSIAYGEAEDYKLRVSAPSAAPANDLCANATNLPCGTTSLAGTTVGSTSVAYGTTCTMSNYGVWYTFVGDGIQTTISSTSAAGFDHEMSISSGNCTTKSSIACIDVAGGGGTESHTFTPTNGIRYYLYIAHYNTSGLSTDTGTFTISRSCAAIVSQNIPTIGSNTVACGTNLVLYDSGGAAGDYVNNSNGYTVLQAGSGATINILGNYNTENNYDYIRIYNGTGTGGTLLNTYTGTGTINYTGTVGQTLTVQFTSDVSSVGPGFALDVTYGGICYPACTGTPTAGTVTTNPTTDWPGTPYIVSATGFTNASGLTFQ